MKKLVELLDELEKKIPQQEVINLAISKASVGWHIEHSLLTINTIIQALRKSNPKYYKWTFKLSRLVVFTINKIPRGRAQSPAVVSPTVDFNVKTLHEHLNNTKQRVVELNSLQANNYIEHPFFGKLNLKQTNKFLVIHTRHHLNIINDIIASLH